MNRKQKWYILGTIFCILLGIQLLVNVTWFDYWHGNVKYEYDAKIKQLQDVITSKEGEINQKNEEVSKNAFELQGHIEQSTKDNQDKIQKNNKKYWEKHKERFKEVRNGIQKRMV